MPLSTALPSLTPAQRTLTLLAVVTTLSGLVHIGVWLAAGQPSLVGPVTWRKPIVFGLSLGVLAASLVWVVRLLPDTPALTRQARWLLWLLLAELTLIDMQQWRGVGSHFNVATAFDGAVFQAMGLLILAATAILGWWTLQLWRAPRTDAPREQLAAARAGMVLLAAGNLIGIGLSVWGVTVLENTGAPPQALGQAGNLKLTHAVALHGLQVLPLLAVLVAPIPDAMRRLSLVRLAAAGYFFVLVVALWQALAGRAPDDLAPVSLALLIVAGVSVATTAAAGVRARLTAPRVAALRERA